MYWIYNTKLSQQQILKISGQLEQSFWILLPDDAVKRWKLGIKIHSWLYGLLRERARWIKYRAVGGYPANGQEIAIPSCPASLFGQDIHLINQARGPYWENIGPRSWQYGQSAARSVHKRQRADILPVRARASLVNKRFITRLKKAKTTKTQVRDHSGQCPVRYSENIGPAIEHFDWLILVIGPLTAWVV